jgi:hypothetical protein
VLHADVITTLRLNKGRASSSDGANIAGTPSAGSRTEGGVACHSRRRQSSLTFSLPGSALRHLWDILCAVLQRLLHLEAVETGFARYRKLANMNVCMQPQMVRVALMSTARAPHPMTTTALSQAASARPRALPRCSTSTAAPQ